MGRRRAQDRRPHALSRQAVGLERAGRALGAHCSRACARPRGPPGCPGPAARPPRAPARRQRRPLRRRPGWAAPRHRPGGRPSRHGRGRRSCASKSMGTAGAQPGPAAGVPDGVAAAALFEARLACELELWHARSGVAPAPAGSPTRTRLRAAQPPAWRARRAPAQISLPPHILPHSDRPLSSCYGNSGRQCACRLVAWHDRAAGAAWASPEAGVAACGSRLHAAPAADRQCRQG